MIGSILLRHRKSHGQTGDAGTRVDTDPGKKVKGLNNIMVLLSGGSSFYSSICGYQSQSMKFR